MLKTVANTTKISSQLVFDVAFKKASQHFTSTVWSTRHLAFCARRITTDVSITLTGYPTIIVPRRAGSHPPPAVPGGEWPPTRNSGTRPNRPLLADPTGWSPAMSLPGVNGPPPVAWPPASCCRNARRIGDP